MKYIKLYEGYVEDLESEFEGELSSLKKKYISLGHNLEKSMNEEIAEIMHFFIDEGFVITDESSKLVFAQMYDIYSSHAIFSKIEITNEILDELKKVYKKLDAMGVCLEIVMDKENIYSNSYLRTKAGKKTSKVVSGLIEYKEVANELSYFLNDSAYFRMCVSYTKPRIKL